MGKKDAKGKGKSPASSTTLKSSAFHTPAPYQKPPRVLDPFLTFLNPKHVYITHIDVHSPTFKARIFTVPVIMNLALIALLGYRALYIGPYYYGLLLTIWGYNTPYKVDPATSALPVLLDETVRRTLILLFDVILVTFVVPWPWDFFVGSPSNPTWWRISVGFQPEEIIVRRSRPSWDTKLAPDWLEEKALDPAPYRDRIMPAIDRQWVAAKTAYLMMDKSWDLDFGCMVNAHELVEQEKCKLEDFKKQVLVHSDKYGGWLVWPVWKLDDKVESGEIPVSVEEGGGGAGGRQKIVEFKDKLTKMGKENLFFRWIEVVQFQASQPGGFTKQRQAQAMREAKQLFEEQGVDFDQFWKDVGGMESMPGMETDKEQEEDKGK